MDTGSSIQDLGYRSLTVGSSPQELGGILDRATGRLELRYTQELGYRSLNMIQKLSYKSLVQESGYRMVGQYRT